jgi:hypothetical protein
MMEAIAFYNLYNAGRATLGVPLPPVSPFVLQYVYRAFPNIPSRGSYYGFYHAYIRQVLT